MQNKIFTGVIAVMLALICAFYISFSFVTMHHEGKAKEYAAATGSAEGDDVYDIRYKHYIDSISTKKVYLNYYTFKQCREMGVGLGLDLKGGMTVVLQISVPDVLKQLSNNNTDPNFIEAIAQTQERIKGSAGDEDAIDIFVEEYKRLDPNVQLSAVFSGATGVSASMSNDEVADKLHEILDQTVEDSYNVLRNRIDRFGVVAPNIQKLGGSTGRILVELPGVKEPERVHKLLKGAANLEFWETYEQEEVMPQLTRLNRELELSLQTPSPLFSKLNTSYANGPVLGIAQAGDTAAINAILNSSDARGILYSNLVTRWSAQSIDDEENLYQLVALKSSRDGKPAMSGDIIETASNDFRDNRAVVNMTMKREASRQWENITRNNRGKCVAVVLDGVAYTWPVVRSVISDGSSEISGQFTPEEAKDLANVLRSGKMAAGIDIVQEEIIGPSLGKEAINSGIISFAVALLLLMIYMVVMYGFVPGMVVNCGLLLNFFFTLGVLASIQAVLTLSGIAGIVLSLGMAIDANILIFERTKEELRAGKGLRAAIADGYKNAFSAIFDSNLTSLITGIILLMYGTGPIKGFATTLIIGIIISFFIAIFLTRMVIEWIASKEWGSKLTFTTGISKKLLVNNNINFLGLRKIGYICAVVLVAIMAVSFATRGVKQGIDFSGGRNYVVAFESPANIEEIRKALAPEFEGSSLSVINIQDKNQVRISTNYRVNDMNEEADQEILEKLYNGLKGMINDASIEDFKTDNIVTIQKVGPSIADDIKTGAMWAVFFSLIAIFLYILLRFRDVAFSVGTLVSLAFTTFIIIGLYSLLYGILPFSMEIDQTFIAAILTVIGYAVNDNVVVFDRIREELQLYPKRNRVEVINSALNSTLSRTLNTSLSTALVLLVIFILGVDTIRSFVFAMLFGVIVGTLSTLFIATPIAYEIQKRRMSKKGIVFDESVLLKK